MGYHGKLYQQTKENPKPMKTTQIPISVNLFTVFLILLVVISCSGDKKAQTADTTPAATQTDEWISLFDGETLNGWKRYNADDIGELWKVEDGMIVCYSEGGGEATAAGGSLITTAQFDNFELTVDFKLSPSGNSGLLYHVVEKPEYAYAYVTGPEYQLMDDASAPASMDEAKQTASTYDMFAPSADKKLNPAGEWNTAKIIYNNGHVEHWLNGQKVLEFEEGSDAWQTRYESSKWTEYSGWCQYKKGSIALQDHGNYTWFRNIKIKKL